MFNRRHQLHIYWDIGCSSADEGNMLYIHTDIHVVIGALCFQNSCCYNATRGMYLSSARSITSRSLSVSIVCGAVHPDGHARKNIHRSITFAIVWNTVLFPRILVSNVGRFHLWLLGFLSTRKW